MSLLHSVEMAATAASRYFMLVGQCVPTVKQNASKIKIKRLELDTNLLMYFKKDEFIYAHDPNKTCKSGDIVLVKELPQKLTRLITHEVMQIVYPLGDITDPITGKKVVVGKYRDEIDKETKLYGELDSRFKYEDAPPRGWQENRKDFTHKETYIKYHEFDNDDQPFSV